MKLTALFFGFYLLFSTVGAAHAQPFTLPGIPGLSGGSSGQAEKEEASPEELEASLEVTIQALQDDDSRRALVEQLKSIQQGLQAEASQTAKESASDQGLLGALSFFFREATDPDSAAETSLGKWKTHFHNAYLAAKKLLTGASFRVLAETLAGNDAKAAENVDARRASGAAPLTLADYLYRASDRPADIRHVRRR